MAKQLWRLHGLVADHIHTSTPALKEFQHVYRLRAASSQGRSSSWLALPRQMRLYLLLWDNWDYFKAGPTQIDLYPKMRTTSETQMNGARMYWQRRNALDSPEWAKESFLDLIPNNEANEEGPDSEGIHKTLINPAQKQIYLMIVLVVIFLFPLYATTLISCLFWAPTRSHGKGTVWPRKFWPTPGDHLAAHKTWPMRLKSRVDFSVHNVGDTLALQYLFVALFTSDT